MMKLNRLIACGLLGLSLAAEAPLVIAQERPVQYQTVVARRYREPRHTVYVKRRSRKKSAAIVGGSALAGAGIGALAGGGKGAAIGAIAGGGAGLVYDRKTHKKVVVR